MSLPGKIAALLTALRQGDVDAMPPAERRRFADLLLHWSRKAELPPTTTRSGLLADIADKSKGRE